MAGNTRWGPYTSMKALEQRGPLVISRADGVYVWDEGGRRYLDAHAGLWLANVGYGRQEIIEAMHRQASELAWFSSFGGFANRPSLDLADRLVDLLRPDAMGAVFLSGSGSEAVETSLKLARQYWKVQGHARKVKFIGREQAYHGVTLGALSVSGIPANRTAFEPLLPEVRHVPAPLRHACRFHAADAACTLACAEELERTIVFEGPETVAAFIAEPVQAAGGVIVPPPEYLSTVAEICRRYEVLLITDEVVTGFGRLGCWTGARHYAVRPDMMAFAKGLTSGYFPMGATAVRGEILDTVRDSAGAGTRPEFLHGNTYSGHPIGAAAALANLAIIEQERLPERAAKMGRHLRKQLAALQSAYPAWIQDVDSEGLLGRIALKTPPDAQDAGSAGQRAVDHMREHSGVIARSVGSVLTLSPALTVAPEEIDAIVTAAGDAIAAVCRFGDASGS